MVPRRPPIACIGLVALVACARHASRRPDGGASDVARAAEPAVARAPAPFVPSNCGYTVRAVSPGRPPVTSHAPRFGADPDPRNLHLTFVGEAATSVVVQWSTGADTLASEVRFGRDGAALDRVATGYSFAYGGSGRRREHEVHLCGLEPATRYAYEAGGEGHRATRYAFTTAPAGPAQVRALVAGDARSDPAMWGVVARAAMAERPDVMLFTGDAVVDGASQPAWDEFFGASVELMATTPGLWADGNHEGISEVYFAQFAFPENGVPHRHEHWFASTYGPMRVLVLNDTTVSSHEIATVETDWLRDELSRVDRDRTPWVVTMHHQPLFTTSVGHLPDRVTRDAWEPLFDRFHVDVDLAGHVHNYESTLPIFDGAATDSAHGTRYFVFGGGGAPLYRFLARAPWTDTRESTHGFALLTVDAHSLVQDARRIDGSRIERVEIAR